VYVPTTGLLPFSRRFSANKREHETIVNGGELVRPHGITFISSTNFLVTDYDEHNGGLDHQGVIKKYTTDGAP